MPKKVLVYYRTNSSKLVWFGIILLVRPKYHLWGIFSTQFLSKITNFVSEVENIGKYKFLKFTIPSYMLLYKVIFKIFNSHFFSIPMRNCYFLTKIEWEKYPISDILDKPIKVFQIRRFCASLFHNKPWPFLVSKAA